VAFAGVSMITIYVAEVRRIAGAGNDMLAVDVELTQEQVREVIVACMAELDRETKVSFLLEHAP
jgi:hypothetical protein